jgi:ABC-type branched-subunit amino acid transport system ATPase component
MKLTITNGSVTLSGNTILESVNIDINSGDKIAIVGRNGAGKTTLVKAIIDNSLFDEGIGEEKFNITKIGNFDINTDIKNTTGNGVSNSAIFVPIGILEIKHDIIRLIRIEEKTKDDFFDIIPNLMSNINVNEIIKNIKM